MTWNMALFAGALTGGAIGFYWGRVSARHDGLSAAYWYGRMEWWRKEATRLGHRLEEMRGEHQAYRTQQTDRDLQAYKRRALEAVSTKANGQKGVE